MYAFPSVTHGGVTFLAHYNEGMDADYSISGKTKAEVKDVQLSGEKKGYPFPNSAPSAQAADIGYSKDALAGAGLCYDASNLDVRQGTIQMWVKTKWDWNNTAQERMDHVDKNRYFLRLMLQGDAFSSINLYFACDVGHVFLPHLMFYVRDGKRDYTCNAKTGAEAPTEFKWQKDTWHYLVATWTPTRMAIYADGRKLSEQSFVVPMDCPMPKGPIIIGSSAADGRPAEALIDEVRILDHALSEQEATVVPAMELATTIQGANLAAGGQATFFRPERRRYYAPKAAAPPAIDGNLSDKIWTGVPVAAGFVKLGLESKLEKYQGEAQAAWDDKNLYLALFFHEDRMNSLRTATNKAGDLGVFSDDATEIILSGAKDGRPFAQIGINAANVVAALYYKPDGGRSPWDKAITSATRRDKNGWTIEAAIPFEHLQVKPKVGAPLRWNIGRDRRAGGGLEYSSLNFVFQSFTEAADFGDLILTGEMKEGKGAEEARLNRDFLTRSGQEFAELASRIEREIGFIKDVSARAKEQAGILAAEQELVAAGRDFRALAARLPAPACAVPADRQQQAGKEPAVREWTASYFRLLPILKLMDEFSSKALALAVAPPEEETQAALRAKPGLSGKGRFIYLGSPNLVAAVDTRTGMLAGLWERGSGRRLIRSSYDIFAAETRSRAWLTDERLNRASRVERKENGVTLASENPDLPGLRFTKNYHFTKTGNEERLLSVRTEIAGKTTESTLVTQSSNCIFDEAFRQESFYDRVFVIGTMGEQRQQVPAKEIVEPLIQRAWFNASEGRAQFSCVNPAAGIGFGEYLIKINDRWAFPQGLAQSWWHRFGWEMGGPGEFFKPSAERKLSFELRYHLFSGDRLAFHREYMEQPEYRAMMNDWQPNPDVQRLYLYGVPSLEGALTYELKKEEWLRDHLLRPDDLAIGITGPDDRRWGEFPAKDGDKVVVRNAATGQDERSIPCEEIKRHFTDIHKRLPNLRLGFYRFLADIYKGAAIYKEHPDWALRDKHGKEMPGMFDSMCVLANMGPGYMDHLMKGLLGEVDYYDEDVVYLDFSVGIWLADWGREEVTGLQPMLDWLKRLHAELAKRHKILFINSFVGQPYYDMGFHEGDQCRDHWRVSGNVWLMRKFYLPKGVVNLPLYWTGGDQRKKDGQDNEERYRNLVIATGLKTVACYVDPYDKYFPDGKGGTDYVALAQYSYPVHAITRELIPSEFVEIGLAPAWWRDLATEFEAFTLRQGPAFLVNVISHYKDTRAGVFSVDPDRMGFDRNKPVYCWQFIARNQKDFVKAAPQPEGWNRMFKEMNFATLSCKEGPLKLTLDKLESETVRVICLTQEPALICSASGRPTQLLLPENLGCRVGGEMQEARKTLELTVTAEQPAEIAAYWPFPEEPQAMAGKEPLIGSPRKIGGAPFLIFAAPKGVTKVTVSPKKPKGTP
ncbi:MAG: hypothetical protein HY360_07295 [Verrucomicrobia bacterium]|nr:hypothetical protein [Verrucomicrobiota bacterium]